KLGFPMAEPHLRDEVLAQLKAQVEAEAAQAEKSAENK
ncbi:MAG: glycine--tRNA ligase subunit alpha, partial [Acinetobacter sp.]|nr:glycine--tRNA ligase subunit alpha [Pseudomonas sp.]MBC6677051.1 glycine--tRNA ligase subunit alpha [Acinetobacter sp.]